MHSEARIVILRSAQQQKGKVRPRVCTLGEELHMYNEELP